MSRKLKALVASQSKSALKDIQAAFADSPDVELVLYNETDARQPGHVLIVHSQSPVDYLRKLRSRGYTQPALVLTEDVECPRIAPLEEDIRPLENVTWGVLRAGGLPKCVSMMANVL
jgi:hypothetical protein